MAFLSYGLTSGLAQTRDWDNAQKMALYNEQLNNQARLDAQNKVALLGDELAAQHLNTTYDNTQLQAYVENQVKAIGKFVSDNPNFEDDVNLYRQFSAMKRSIKENDIVDRSMRVNSNYAALTKYIQDNPGAEYDPDIQRQLTEYDNYNKTGSIDGVSSNGKEFMFSSPDSKFDLNAAIAGAYKDMQATTVYDPKGIGIGATRTYADPTQLKARADALLGSSSGFNLKRSWDALSPQQQSLYGNDITQWVTTLGSSYVAQGVKAGQVFAPTKSSSGSSGASGKGSSSAFSAFYNDLSGKKPYDPWYSPYAKSLIPMSEDGSYTVPSDGVKIQTLGADGKPSYITLKSLAGTTVKIDPKSVGSGIMGSAGEPYATVRMVVPLTDEMVHGDNPVLKDNSHFFEGWDADEANDTDNDPAYKGIVELEKDADGNNTGNVVIRATVPLLATESTVRAYDVNAEGQLAANKAEGMGLSEMTEQNQIATLQSMGLTVGTLQDGRIVGQAADGKIYDATGAEVTK